MNVLVRAPNAIGDTVLATAAVAAFTRAAPEMPVTIAARGRTYPIWEMAGLGGRVAQLPEGSWRSELPWAIRSRGRFEAGVTLSPSFQSALFLFLAGCRVRAGFRSESRGWLLSPDVGPGPDRKIHLARSYELLFAALLGSLGRPETLTAVLPRLTPGIQATAMARAALERQRGPFVAIAPGAEYGVTKRWPLDRFVETATLLRDSRRWTPVFVGSPAEAELCREAARRSDGIPAVAGARGLAFAAAVIGECKAFVGNDSGLSHVAAALGIPTVSIFGSTSPDWTSPVGRRVATVAKPPHCAPCFGRTCPFALECLTAITPGEVIGALRRAG